MPTESVQFLHHMPGNGACGVPLDDGSVPALHGLALDDSHDQFGSGRPVNWLAVRERSEELLGRSLHLDVAMPYTVALLELDGLPGLVRGLEFVARLVRDHWRDVHPRLDPADKDDPTERIGILDALGAPLASYGDRWQVLMRLRRAPLVSPPAQGELLVGAVLARMPGAVVLPDFPVLEPAVLDAALRSAPVQSLRDVLSLLEAARAHLATIEKAFVDNVPSGRAPNLSALDQELTYVASAITSALNSDTPQVSVPARDSRGASGGTKAQWVDGDIRSRDQVLSALESICAYFEAHEPASPLPLLLWRAHRLVNANFLAAVEDLVPGALADFKAATGFKEPASRPAA